MSSEKTDVQLCLESMISMKKKNLLILGEVYLEIFGGLPENQRKKKSCNTLIFILIKIFH